jgi:large subunit ribosomal protein L24e
MVIRTDICVFSEWRIYPGHGQRFVAKDGRGFTFITKKARTLSISKVKNQRITWTVSWRRHNKKIKSEDAAKKRRKRGGFVQRAIVGINLDDLKKVRSEKPETRNARKEQAEREFKERKVKQSAQK